MENLCRELEELEAIKEAEEAALAEAEAAAAEAADALNGLLCGGDSDSPDLDDPGGSNLGMGNGGRDTPDSSLKYTHQVSMNYFFGYFLKEGFDKLLTNFYSYLSNKCGYQISVTKTLVPSK